MTDARGRPSTRRATLLLLTFLVSFCSFAYEFAFSEELTVLYGNSATQYTITVGLYFFALGVGSALVDDLDDRRWANFVRIELYLSVVAVLGFLAILAVHATVLPPWMPPWVEAVVVRLPPMLVGFLSGFELPFLTRMVERESSDGVAVPASVQWVSAAVRAAVRRVLGAFFYTSPAPERRSGLSVVLTMDYLGGLVGAVVYVRVLYPRLGLITTVFALAFLNVLAALLFVVRFGGVPWSVPAPEDVVTRERTTVVVALLLVGGLYGGALVEHERVDREVTEFYLESTFEADFAPPGDPGARPMQVDVVDQHTTAYQNVVLYDRTWTGDGPNPYFEGRTERCLRLDTAVQLCESWADSYHAGLVDVPLSMYENGTDTDVLVVGGGDWIAVDRLRDHGVDVDLVDVDREFMEYAKDSPLLSRYHEDSYEYEHLDVTVADGFRYVAETNRTYDVVLLDVPGARDDSLMPLYSEEFYRNLRGVLEPDGVVATWVYARSSYPQHHKAYVTTVDAAGFEQYRSYWAYEDLNGDGSTDPVERFYLLSPDGSPPRFDGDGSAYVRRYADRYRETRWRPLPRYDGVEPNSVFDPNYDILIP